MHVQITAADIRPTGRTWWNRRAGAGYHELKIRVRYRSDGEIIKAGIENDRLRGRTRRVGFHDGGPKTGPAKSVQCHAVSDIGVERVGGGIHVED